MPQNVAPNTQNQEYTTSDNGRNVRPALVSKSHFFIESSGDGAFSQTEAQKFGAISPTQFRTTAKVSATGKVYAICQGQVFLQPQEGSTTKVNLILRPYKQPIRELPIKYFIYRGLNRSDFLDANDKVFGEGVDFSSYNDGYTGFINHVRGEFDAFYSHLPDNEKPPFKASMIGFPEDANQPLDSLMDEYFNKISIYDDDDQQNESETTQFEFPLIKKGLYLGTIADGEIGLDIVLNNGDYYVEYPDPTMDPNKFRLDLAFARKAEHILDTTIITATGEEGAYQKKLIKEACTQFMDVAAFYGMHCNGQGTLTTTNADAETASTTIEDIYAHVKNFNTHNTQYLYIQSNRQRSYNFYNNYKYSVDNTSNIKIGETIDNLIEETTFGTLEWPIHIIENQENTYIQLTTDNHEGAALHTKLGRLITEHEQNFVRNVNLQQELSEDADNPVDINYTKPIGFTTFTEDTNAIATCIQLIYEGKQLKVSEYVPPPAPGEDPITPQQYLLKDIDDVFGLINAKSFLQTKPNVVELPSVIEEQLQLINFPNTQESKDVGVVKTKRIKDTIQINETENIQRVTYETLLLNIKNENSSYIKSNSPSIDKSATGTHSFSSEQNNFYQPVLPYLIKKKEFTVDGQSITGLQLETIDDSFPTKRILGITYDENVILKNIISDNNLTNSSIYLKNVLDINEDTFTSIEGVNYNVYKLEILAENNQGQLKIYKPIDEVSVFSIDDFIYASDNYGKFTPDNEVADYSNQQIPEEL